MSAPALAARPVARPAARPVGRPDPGSAARQPNRQPNRQDPREQAPRPRMRVVERPELGPRRLGFAVSCTALLGSLMLGLLLLNVAISGNAFTVAELQSERSLLVDRQQSLEQSLLVRAAPSALASRARGLGMVPAPQTIVLAPDGTGAPPPQAAP